MSLMENKPDVVLIIDGNNVVFNERKELQLKRLLVLRKDIKLIGKCFVVVSHSLKYRIDNQEELEKLLLRDDFIETPNGVENDLYILEMARKLNAYIVSNDKFRQYKDLYSEIIDKRKDFLLVSTGREIYSILPWRNEFTKSSRINLEKNCKKEKIPV